MMITTDNNDVDEVSGVTLMIVINREKLKFAKNSQITCHNDTEMNINVSNSLLQSCSYPQSYERP